MDTEERVSEPLECGHDWMLWGTLVGIKKCRGAPLRAPQDSGHTCVPKHFGAQAQRTAPTAIGEWFFRNRLYGCLTGVGP